MDTHCHTSILSYTCKLNHIPNPTNSFLAPPKIVILCKEESRPYSPKHGNI
jgi:hypothetical protein